MKPSEQNSEWLTRKRLIDPKLKAAGWNIVPFSAGMSLNSSRNCAITEFETANGPADYALCADGVILGIVEAKKVSLVFFRNEVLVVQNDIEKRTMNLQAALAIVNEA